MNQAAPSSVAPETSASTARFASRAAVITFAGVAFNGLLYLYFAVQTRAWQLYGLAGVAAAVSALLLAAAALARRGRSTQAAQLILAAGPAAFLAVTLLISGASLIYGLTMLCLTAIIAPNALPAAAARRWILFSAGVTVVLFLFDLAGPAYRIPLPQNVGVAHTIGLAGVILWLTIQATRQLSRHSLLARLVFLVAAVAMAVAGTVAAFFFYSTIRDLQAETREKIQAESADRARGIETYLEPARTDVLLLARSPTLAAYLASLDTVAVPAEHAEALQALQADFIVFANVRQIYDQVRYIDAAGREVVRVNRLDDGQYEVVPEADLQDKSARPYFQAATRIARGEVYVSAIELNRDNGTLEVPYNPIVRFATPIYFDGMLRGILVTNVLAEPFLQRLGQESVPTLLVDQDGYYIYHPDSGLRWGRELQTGITIAQQFPHLAPLLQPNESGIANVDGYLFAYAPVNVSPLTGASLLVVSYLPQAEAAAPATSALLPGLGVLAAALAAAVAIASLTTRAVLAPLQELTQAVEAMSAGDLSTQAPVRAPDEIGTVAQAVNGMAANLRLLIDSLETRVAERTAELETANQGLSAEVANRQQAEVSLQEANDQLKVWLGELEQHGRDLSLLSGLSELLQSCNDVDEAYDVFRSLAAQFFPREPGALCITAASRNTVEAVVQWGAPPATRSVFAPEDCWALRRGRPHLAEPGSLSPACRHAATPAGRPHICLPLLAQNEALGILTLYGEEFSDSRRQMAQSLSDQIALALANLRLRETLRSQSIRDPLTDLHNRRYMEESLERELRRAARARYPVSVLMIDLDHFKRFNDTFGHAAGDTALKEVGLSLRAHIRGGDIACRYGGEEFVVIMPEAGLEAACNRADALRESVQHLNVRHGGQALGTLTLSVGVAAFPGHGAATSDLLQAADAALYQAKHAGRNRVVTADEIEVDAV